MPRVPDLEALARQGVAVVIATCDAELRPTVGRGWGPLVDPEAGTLTLCIDAAPGTPAHADIAAGSPLAVTLTRPSSYLGVQVKGRVLELREPTAADRDRVAAHVDAFCVETAPFGLLPARTRRLVAPGLMTAVMAIAERYDQTPGPGAGSGL